MLIFLLHFLISRCHFKNRIFDGLELPLQGSRHVWSQAKMAGQRLTFMMQRVYGRIIQRCATFGRTQSKNIDLGGFGTVWEGLGGFGRGGRSFSGPSPGAARCSRLLHRAPLVQGAAQCGLWWQPWTELHILWHHYDCQSSGGGGGGPIKTVEQMEREERQTRKEAVLPVSASFSPDGTFAVGYRNGGIVVFRPYKSYGCGNFQHLPLSWLWKALAAPITEEKHGNSKTLITICNGGQRLRWLDETVLESQLSWKSFTSHIWLLMAWNLLIQLRVTINILEMFKSRKQSEYLW